MKRINMAIMGVGNIARQMAAAINGLEGQVCAYGVCLLYTSPSPRDA